MRGGRAIGDARGTFGTDSLETIPKAGRDRHEAVVVRPEKELLHDSGGRRIGSFVVYDELYPAINACIVESHLLMQVPAFDDPRINRREVNLAEPLEVTVGCLQHVVNSPPLVRQAFQRDLGYALDHSVIT